MPHHLYHLELDYRRSPFVVDGGDPYVLNHLYYLKRNGRRIRRRERRAVLRRAVGANTQTARRGGVTTRAKTQTTRVKVDDSVRVCGFERSACARISKDRVSRAVVAHTPPPASSRRRARLRLRRMCRKRSCATWQ